MNYNGASYAPRKWRPPPILPEHVVMVGAQDRLVLAKLDASPERYKCVAYLFREDQEHELVHRTQQSDTVVLH